MYQFHTFGHQAVPTTNGCYCSIAGYTVSYTFFEDMTCYAYCAR